MSIVQVLLRQDRKISDVNDDHHFVIRDVLETSKEKVPYLFSVADGVKDDRLIIVQTDKGNIQTHLRDRAVAVSSSSETGEFVIRVNPAIKRKCVNQNGELVDRLYPITDEADIASWFKDKLETHLIKAQQVSVLSRHVLDCSRSQSKINTAVLRVSYSAETGAINWLQKNGIGKRKGYGFGLPLFSNNPFYPLWLQINE